MIIYWVKSGETLSQIARRYGVPWKEIAAASGISDPRTLRAGQAIRIPVAPRELPPAPSGTRPGVYDIQNGPFTRHRWPRPAGARVRWLVVHDPVGGTVPATLSVLRANAREVSYHEMIAPGARPTVYRLAPANQLVGHAGVSTRIPGTNAVDGQVNAQTYGFCIYKHKLDSAPLVPAFYDAVVVRLADLVRELSLPDAGVILGHREVSTVRGRRTDPRGVDLERLRRDVAARLGPA